MAYLPFMDRVHGFLFSDKIGKGRTRIPGDAKRVLARHRAQLRRAEKFVIDDETVRLICHLSHEKDQLEGWSFLARLPFEVCWFEFNLHAKVSEFDKMNSLPGRFNPETVSPVIGYLLYRDDAGSASPRWVLTQFYEVEGGSVVPGLLSYVFDPEGSDYSPVRGSTYWRAKTLSMIPGFPKLPVLAELSGLKVSTTCDPEILASGDLRLGNWAEKEDGSFIIPKGTEFETDKDGNMIFHPEHGMITGGGWCYNRLAVIHEPFWPCYHNGNLNNELAGREVREEMGHIRWVVTMLAALNNLPRDVKQAQTLTGRRTVGANILPYFQHRTISLRIPNDDRIVWARKRMQTALRNAPRPWHPVRGHWRIIEMGKAPAHICRHQPTMVENGVGMCEKCQLMIRWIADHTRGDPTIGIVDHTYSVRKK